MDYDRQLESYIKINLGIKNYDLKFKEKGAIPLFYPAKIKEGLVINSLDLRGGMTRLSNGIYIFKYSRT